MGLCACLVFEESSVMRSTGAETSHQCNHSCKVDSFSSRRTPWCTTFVRLPTRSNMCQQPSSINDQRRSSGILVHSKTDHSLSIVSRLSSASKRDTPFLLEEFFVVSVILVDGRHLTGEVARRKRVHPHFETLEVHS